MTRRDFRRSPAILGWFRDELADSRGLTLLELESAFVGFWAPVLHSFWLGGDATIGGPWGWA